MQAMRPPPVRAPRPHRVVHAPASSTNSSGAAGGANDVALGAMDVCPELDGTAMEERPATEGPAIEPARSPPRAEELGASLGGGRGTRGGPS